MTRRGLLVSLLLALAACAQDDPTIDSGPLGQPTEQPPAADDEIVVTAVEYEFQGMPETLSEGEYTFTLENAGKEKHELYLMYITGPQSIEELLELPSRSVSKLTQAVDRIVAPYPDQPISFSAALVPGRFGYVCYFRSPDRTLHSALGMRGEFTVA